LIVLCDVDNPLLGKDGAAAIFGPQKGAGDSDIKNLKQQLTRLRDITLAETGIDIWKNKLWWRCGRNSSRCIRFFAR